MQILDTRVYVPYTLPCIYPVSFWNKALYKVVSGFCLLKVCRAFQWMSRTRTMDYLQVDWNRTILFHRTCSSLLLAPYRIGPNIGQPDDRLPPNCRGFPWPVLQHADDTLIVARGEPEDAAGLKLLLEHFAEATRLHINYKQKGIVVPSGRHRNYSRLGPLSVLKTTHNTSTLPIGDH